MPVTSVNGCVITSCDEVRKITVGYKKQKNIQNGIDPCIFEIYGKYSSFVNLKNLRVKSVSKVMYFLKKTLFQGISKLYYFYDQWFIDSELKRLKMKSYYNLSLHRARL